MLQWLAYYKQPCALGKHRAFSCDTAPGGERQACHVREGRAVLGQPFRALSLRVSHLVILRSAPMAE